MFIKNKCSYFYTYRFETVFVGVSAPISAKVSVPQNLETQLNPPDIRNIPKNQWVTRGLTTDISDISTDTTIYNFLIGTFWVFLSMPNLAYVRRCAPLRTGIIC